MKKTQQILFGNRLIPTKLINGHPFKDGSLYCNISIVPFLFPIESNINSNTFSQRRFTLLISYNTYLDAQNTYFNAHDTYFNAHDTYFNAHNTYLNTQNTYFNAHDTYFNVHNTYLNAHNTYFNAHNTYFNAHNTYFNDRDAHCETINTTLYLWNTLVEHLKCINRNVIRFIKPKLRVLEPVSTLVYY